ncbi:MAG: hypothetical protein ACTSQE_07125 [Candidatus Heimdallarchaeaceae archaeon]
MSAEPALFTIKAGETIETRLKTQIRGDIDKLQNKILFLQELLDESLLLLYKQLSQKQQDILLIAYKMLQYNSCSMNKLAEQIANSSKLAFSTIKWNILKLKELGFFETLERREKRQFIIRMTELGKIMLSLITKINCQT